MQKRLAKDVKIHLDKARECVMMAVEVYNRPSMRFRSGGFIVLMIVAWTALFHAIFLKRKIKPFYREKDSSRFVRIDGDYKAWELVECVRRFYGVNSNPIRSNLEFFAGLRNKIEHRSMPQLDHQIFGECQALLFNFEELLFSEFGPKNALNESLALALQFSHLRPATQIRAVKGMLKPLQKDVANYITQFRSSLSSDQLHDLGFSYKVFLIPKLANNPGQADVAVEFVKYDSSKPAEMEKYDRVVALIKPSVVQAQNVGRLKPADVCKAVELVVKKVVGPHAHFTASYHHVGACRLYKVRPPKGKGDPRQTISEYCIYDDAHADYVYTTQWKQFLIEELKKPGQYQRILDAYKQ